MLTKMDVLGMKTGSRVFFFTPMFLNQEGEVRRSKRRATVHKYR